MRTFAALLAFFAICTVVWLAVILAWGAVVWSTGFDDREDAIGLIIVLYLAPLITFAAAIAGAMVIVTPRQSRSKR